MTSRAGQALPAKQRLFAALHGDDDVPSWLRQIAEDIEQEVRDDIAARVEALPGMNGRHDAVGGALEVSREAVLADISSSSATETQDGPRTDDEFRERPCPACGAALAPADTHWNLMTDAYECPVATETQDGERHYQRWHRDSKHDFGLGKCAVCDKPWPCPDAATPTPDDRDREVERSYKPAFVSLLSTMKGIARDRSVSSLVNARQVAEAAVARAEEYDAGLRASGGD